MNKEEIENKLDEMMSYLSKENISREDEIYTNFVVDLQKAKNYIEQLENKVKEQEAEIKKKNKTIASNDRLIWILGIDLDDAEKEVEKKDKIIKEMIEYIDIECDCIKGFDNCENIDDPHCKQCIIQYFENKVKEERNE